MRPVGGGEERSPIVVLHPGYPTRGFANLAAAAAMADAAAVIELRFSGPMTSAPVAVLGKGLTIRAGAGFRPVLVSAAAEETFLRVDGPLSLRGIEIRSAGADSDLSLHADPSLLTRQLGPDHVRERFAGGDFVPSLLQTRGGDIKAVDCRFVTALGSKRAPDGMMLTGCRRTELSGCEFFNLGGVAIHWRNGVNRQGGQRGFAGEISITNCLFFTLLPLHVAGLTASDWKIDIAQSTLAGGVLFMLGGRANFDLSLRGNVVAMRHLFDPLQEGSLPPNVRWRERGNLFSNPLDDDATRSSLSACAGRESPRIRFDFAERLRPWNAHPRRLERGDFRIAESDAATAGGRTWTELQGFGVRPAGELGKGN